MARGIRAQVFFRQTSSKIVPNRFKKYSTPDGPNRILDTVPVVDEFDHLKFGDIRRFIIGCLFTLLIASLNGVLYNVYRRNIWPTFDAPAFQIWFRCLFRSFTFPLYALIRWIFLFVVRRKPQPENRLSSILAEGSKVYGDKEVSPSRFLLDISCLTIMSIVSQWLSMAPLFAVDAPGDMAALASCNLSFVFILCIIFLKIATPTMKMFGVVLNLSGVFVLTLAEIVGNPKWKTTILILPGAFFTAAYQVAFRMRVGGTTNLARINYFTSMLAIFMTVFMWPLVLTLKFSGAEVWEFNDLPLSYLLISSSAVSIMVLIINAGISYINPFFTSMAFLLTCPATYALEFVIGPREKFYFIDIMGACIAVLGSILLVFAEVPTRTLVSRQWRNVKGNLKMFRSQTKESMSNSLEPKSIRINNDQHQKEAPHRELFTVESSLALPEWSKDGSYKSVYDTL